MKVFIESALSCHECGALLEPMEPTAGLFYTVRHPAVSCSASGQQFERPTIELKAVEV